MKLLCTFLLLTLPAGAQAVHGGGGILLPAPPAAQAIPTTSLFLDAHVEDNYRWLEDGTSPATQEFVRAQNAYAARYLEQARKHVDGLDELAELESISVMSVPIARADTLFFIRRLAGEQAASLYVSRPLKAVPGKPASAAEKRLLDLAALSTDADLELQIKDVARDGSLVAFALVSSATGDGAIRVVNAATGKILEDELPRGRYPSVAFAPDGRGFYYARSTRQGPLLYLHRLGTRVTQDTLIFGREFRGEQLGPRDSFTACISGDARYLVITIERGEPADRTDIVFRDLNKPDQPFEVLVWELEAHFRAVWAANSWFVATDYKAPRGRIFKADPGVMPDAWETVVPESANPIAGWTVAGAKLVVTWLKDGELQTALLSLAGKPQNQIRHDFAGRLSALSAGVEERFAYFSAESPLRPPAIYRLDTATGQTEIVYRPRTAFAPSQYQMARRELTTSDGVRLPILLVGQKGLAQDGSRRLLLMPQYGAGLSAVAGWRPLAAWWVEQGGWVALVNVWKGLQFHQGELIDQRKQVFEDWFQTARFLISQSFSSSQRMAMLSTAPGDLLPGAVLAWHPELFVAVAADDPVFDLLVPFLPPPAASRNGVLFRATDPKPYPELLQVSAYHHVASGAGFPAVLLLAGQAGGIDSLQARKAAALLQARSSGGRPILLEAPFHAGGKAPEGQELWLQEETDRAVFLWTETGANSSAP